MAFAVLAPAFIAACSDDSGPAASPVTTTTTDPTGATETTTRAPDETTSTGAEPAAPALTWARAALGSVSAYILARGSEVAVVDTGNPGSADDIGQTLADIGLNYGNVDHVFLTHLHPDHIGSITEVMAEAAGATAYAGEADIAGIDYDPIAAVRDGDEIFGLEVLATPGHTDGHISVIDHEAGLLVAGDAVITQDGGVQGPSARFSTDLDRANDSVRRLAQLSFNTLLAGHGDPVEDMADTAVAAMAASL